MSKKILIIGGVAGGATAATRLRRLNEEDTIILFEKGEYISFANCGLPYHIGGEIKERDNLLLQTVEGMEQQYALDIRYFSEVTTIDPLKNEVTVLNHQTSESYTESFDELIISTGAKAITPPIQGMDSAKNVFSLRNIPDMDLIKDYIAKHDIQTATIIGGGFIGLEMMVVFSGDMDKALASMIIATGAAAMGKQVTIFFTFWGLSVLKKKKIKKHGLAKLFDIMLPSNADHLPISSMNMGGAGAKMIKSVMKNKNVDPLPVMLEKANNLGVKFIACTMSMDIMGIEREELFDFVEFGGVATYLGDSEDSNLNLFI